MIQKITIENFFSFGNKITNIELNQDTNILVGINGSGKSNFIKAIRLLYESIIGDGFEKIFLKEWSGYFAVANFNEANTDIIRISYEFDKDKIHKFSDYQGYRFPKNPTYELTVHRSGSNSYYLEEKLYSESVKGNKEDFLFLEMKNGRGIISSRESGKVGLQSYSNETNAISFKTQEPVLRQISDPNRFYPLYTLKTAIEGLIVYDYFDTTLNSKIRQPASFGVEQRLLSNGENLAQILNRLKNQHTLHYEKIQEAIKKINPHFIDTGFDLLGSLLYLVLREKKLSKSVGARHISDGTLRYLLLLTILFNPERGNLICIDEPEIGLHPDMINTIAEAIKIASRDSQMIIATHSPLLLNSFELEDIIVFEKDDSNQTYVKVKSEEDFADWNEDYLAGQMWLRGQLGGKRW
ncbi:MAG: AAA family ATPase [Bacteroidales bacterium]|nr:AAA family ATPase [Bacteroidales bacterium]MCF8457095.1 AAA family ATPase [Bacteroidales bacterium]